MKTLPEGTKVIVHSLGPDTPGEFRCIIRGRSFEFPAMCLYIVEVVDAFDLEYEYSCCLITSACVREDFS